MIATLLCRFLDHFAPCLGQALTLVPLHTPRHDTIIISKFFAFPRAIPRSWLTCPLPSTRQSHTPNKQRSLGGHVAYTAKLLSLWSVSRCPMHAQETKADLYLCSPQSTQAMAGQGLPPMILRTRRSNPRSSFAITSPPYGPSTAHLSMATALGAGPPPSSLGSGGSLTRRARGTACEPCRKNKAACEGRFPCNR